jgi:hypothetical protein
MIRFKRKVHIDGREWPYLVGKRGRYVYMAKPGQEDCPIVVRGEQIVERGRMCTWCGYEHANPCNPLEIRPSDVKRYIESNLK